MHANFEKLRCVSSLGFLDRAEIGSHAQKKATESDGTELPVIIGLHVTKTEAARRWNLTRLLPPETVQSRSFSQNGSMSQTCTLERSSL